MAVLEGEATSRLAHAAALLGGGQPAGFHLAASPEGWLIRRDQPVSLNFGFNFRDRAFSANATSEGGNLRVTFFSEFGVVPFTHEDRLRRAQILEYLPRLRDAGLRWEITKEQSVRVGASFELDGVTAPQEILAGMIECLMMTRAALDAMAALAYVPVRFAPRTPRQSAS
jgi:hypothetical protein